MGECIRKRVMYDMSSKRFQYFVNVEGLLAQFSCKLHWNECVTMETEVFLTSKL